MHSNALSRLLADEKLFERHISQQQILSGRQSDEQERVGFYQRPGGSGQRKMMSASVFTSRDLAKISHYVILPAV